MGRTARPEDLTRAVLVAPLRLPAPGWGSRAVADLVGVSQSMVSRVWAQTYANGTSDLAGLRDHELRLVGASVSRGNSLLVLHGRPAVEELAPASTFMKSVRRPPLQALLAADLLRASYERPDGGARDGEADQRLLLDLAQAGSTARVVLALTREPLQPVDGVLQVVVPEPFDWQALLAPLVRATTRQPPSELQSMQLRLMEWARGRRRRVEWNALAVLPDVSAAPRPSPVPRPVSDQVAQQAFELVLARVASGQLGGGDRVTETSLVRGLRTSRTYVREALRSLAARGLLELEPHRGAVVPVPRVSDVVDTYAARRSLGALLVERAALAPNRDLGPADRALSEMLTIAETGDARATGDADLRFQDALASATSMSHVPEMFRNLTAHVLLLTTVMGLRYVYSIPHMCHDDAEILAAVGRRDAVAAVSLWNSKVTDAVDYMATQL